MPLIKTMEEHTEVVILPLDTKVLDMLEQVTAQKLDSQSTALYGTASLWDDGLIDPRDTRKLLGFLLDICAEAAVRPLKSNTFGVARL